MEEQRSRKRLRLSSESADYIPLLTEEDLEAEFKHHPTYWFDDGNVIIVAEEIGFKVYRDFLKACPSRVSQLLVGSNADEVAVGLPSICHVSEEALNIEILLRWVFQAMSRDSDVEPTSVPECSRFFFVASKYELSGLMKQATAFLERTFVHRLDQFDTLQYRPSSLANHIVGAFLARRYGINHLLPAALLWCCTIQLNKLPSVIDEAHRSINVRGIPWIEEEVWLLRVCVCAALDIQALPVLVNISGLAPTDTCPSNAVCSEVLAALKSDAKLATLNPLISFDRLGNFKRRLKQPCTACREMWSQQYEKQRNEIWETLPLRFGLPPWKELLKRG